MHNDRCNCVQNTYQDPQTVSKWGRLIALGVKNILLGYEIIQSLWNDYTCIHPMQCILDAKINGFVRDCGVKSSGMKKLYPLAIPFDPCRVPWNRHKISLEGIGANGISSLHVCLWIWYNVNNTGNTCASRHLWKSWHKKYFSALNSSIERK